MRCLLFFLLGFLGSRGIVTAQWVYDAEHPLRVTQRENTQTKPRIFSDGAGGCFVFWRVSYPATSDVRLYGQHFTANGIRLFPDSGALIIGRPTVSVKDIAIEQDASGDFLVAWTEGNHPFTDSLFCKKISATNLTSPWPAFRKVAGKFTNSNILGFEEKGLSIVPVSDGYFIGYQVVTGGGGSATFIQKIDMNGNRLISANNGLGEQMTGCSLCYGPFQLLKGPMNGVLLIQRDGNGAGAGLRAYRMNGNGTMRYQNKILTAGTPGLAYGFHCIADDNGGAAFAWVWNPGDVMLSHIDSSGNLDWIPKHVNVCQYPSTQGGPFLSRTGNNWYVAFTDGRSGSVHTYIQKIGLDGTVLFHPNGRKIFGLDDGYGAQPKILSTGNQTMVIAAGHSSTGFVTQEMLDDSTLAWPGYGTLVSVLQYWPSYENFYLARSIEGYIYLAWQSPNPLERVYMAKLGDNGQLVNHAAPIGKDVVRLWPNPATTWLSIEGTATKAVEEVHLFNAVGKSYAIQGSISVQGIRLDVSSLPRGVYFVKISNSAKAMQFIKSE